MSDVPDPAAHEAGMPENFPGQPPVVEPTGLVIDPEADALAKQLDNALDPDDALVIGATDVLSADDVDQAKLDEANLELHDAAADDAIDVDRRNDPDPDNDRGPDGSVDSVPLTNDPQLDLENARLADAFDPSLQEEPGVGSRAVPLENGRSAADVPATQEQQYLIDLGAKRAAAEVLLREDPTNPANIAKYEAIIALEGLLQGDKQLPADEFRAAAIERAKARVDGVDLPPFLLRRNGLASTPAEPIPGSVEPTVPVAADVDPGLTPPSALDQETRTTEQTGAEKLAAIRSLEFRTPAQRREARELGAKQKSFAELHQLGDQRDVEQDAEYNELYADFGSTVEGNGPGRTEAVPVEKSASQTRIEELREREESEGKLNQQESEELNTLEDSQKRYNVLMDKDELNPEERTELTKLSAEWGDPELRAAENEVLGQAEKSLSSPESFANFAKALEMYAVKKSGENLHKAVKDGLATAITEYFARKSSELNPGELRALKQVQELLKGMQQEIVVIMTYKKQLEAQVEAQKKLVKRVEAQQKIVKKNGDIEGNDQKRQRDALVLTAYYNKLAVVNANIILTYQKAQDANFNFAWKHRRVKKALGVGGGYFNDVAIFGDQIRRLKRWSDRQAGSVGTSLPLAEPIRSSKAAAKA